MAKINNTYNKGYFMAHDFDPLEYEREEKRKRKEEKKAGGGGAGSSGANGPVKQTMDLEFAVRCLKCEYVLPRRKRVYAYIEKVEKDKTYDKWIHEFKFHCPQCSDNLVLRSEFARRYETNGFICHKGCERLAGGFDEAHDKEAEEKAAAAEEMANEDFEGEKRLKDHQVLEEQAAELQAFVDKENARNANGGAHSAAMNLVKARERQQELERAQGGGAALQSSSLTDVDGTVIQLEEIQEANDDDKQRFEELKIKMTQNNIAESMMKAGAAQAQQQQTTTTSISNNDGSVGDGFFSLDFSAFGDLGGSGKVEGVAIMNEATSNKKDDAPSAPQQQQSTSAAPKATAAAAAGSKRKRNVLAMLDSDDD